MCALCLLTDVELLVNNEGLVQQLAPHGTMFNDDGGVNGTASLPDGLHRSGNELFSWYYSLKGGSLLPCKCCICVMPSPIASTCDKVPDHGNARRKGLNHLTLHTTGIDAAGLSLVKDDYSGL